MFWVLGSFSFTRSEAGISSGVTYCAIVLPFWLPLAMSW